MQVFDASSMLYAWDNYPVRQFPGLWDWLATQIEENAFVIPSVAFEEIAAKTHECGDWLKDKRVKKTSDNRRNFARCLANQRTARSGE